MNDILNITVVEIGDYTLKLYNLFHLIVFVAVVAFFLVVLKRFIYRSNQLDAAKKFSINKLSRYVIATIAFLIGLKILGFNISVLLAGSAAVLVGLGFGLQSLFRDFISGIILLLDGTLKVNDIIEVNGNIYKVLEINFRTTMVLGRDENYAIVPNSELTGSRVINWTHSQISSRFKVTVGVDYSTDIVHLMQILKAVAIQNPRVLESPESFVRFEEYGDSSLIFSVYFYTNEIFRVENIKSELRVDIFKSLKEHGVNIPFPQCVVHFNPKENEQTKDR